LEFGVVAVRASDGQQNYSPRLRAFAVMQKMKPMKILVFDNYDSFTYNLVHLVQKIVNDKVDVYRNDAISLADVDAYDKIILSPGPGIPSEAGRLLPLIREYAGRKSILGVCLGHQAIGEAFGGRLVNLSTVFHGVATPVRIERQSTVHGPQELTNEERPSTQGNETIHDSRFTVHDSPVDRGPSTVDLFSGLPDEITVGRYHSWIVSEEGLPEELEVTARDAEGYIMGLRHRQYDIEGVQFHPESVLTPDGETILRNWLLRGQKDPSSQSSQ
jgi:anthranilate synthase component 2